MSVEKRGVADCSHLPVFRVATAGSPDLPVLPLLATELVRHRLRSVVVRFPPIFVPRQYQEDLALTAAGIDSFYPAEETRSTCHGTVDHSCLFSFLEELTLRYDIVLVDGDCGLPVNILQLGQESPAIFEDNRGMIRSADPAVGMAACAEILLGWLSEIWLKVPVWACVLIGGKSSRMGRPKHLITRSDGKTWLEGVVGMIRPLVAGVVFAGAGDVPSSLADVARIPDLPGLAGPLAGILAAMRWQPEVNWLLIACDMPSLCPEALQWLIASRRPGRWATIPRRSAGSHVEPLLAHYDRRSRTLFEDVRRAGSLKIGLVARHEKIHSPVIPQENMVAWDNINTPEELDGFIEREQQGTGVETPGTDKRRS